MIKKINDVRTAVKNGTYLSAVALALTFPDICSQVENGVSDGDRTLYMNWVDKYLDKSCFDCVFPGFVDQTFKGNMCYALRCKVLHNGSVDVKSTSVGVSVDQFFLTMPGDANYKKDNYMYVNKLNSDGSETKITYIPIDYLCECICDAAEKFYNAWPHKDDFDTHSF